MGDLPADVYYLDNSRSVDVLSVEYRALRECVRDTLALIVRPHSPWEPQGLAASENLGRIRRSQSPIYIPCENELQQPCDN